MKTARQLLEEFTASSSRDTKKAANMFSEDGMFEMLYLESLGSSATKVVRRFKNFLFVRDLHPEMDFHDVTIVC